MNSRKPITRTRAASPPKACRFRELMSRHQHANMTDRCLHPMVDRLLLLFPERQKALRGRAADHAGDADRDLPQRRSRHAAERDRADADLSPEIEIAPRIRPLGLEFVDGGERVLA